jgi:Holliday junction resolvase RusA-like endonuclease
VTAVRFTVHGKPQPAGSKRAIPIYRKGRQFTGRVAVVEDAKRSKPWQTVVAAAAVEAMDGRELLTGPLALEVYFYVARPAGHYGKGRNASRLRASAPRYPAVKPDTTKLVRAVEDAMTAAGVWRDDAQVVSQSNHKRYGLPERAEVTVSEVGATGHADGSAVAAPSALDRLFASTEENMRLQGGGL